MSDADTTGGRRGFGRGSRHSVRSRESISRNLRRHHQLARERAAITPVEIRDLGRAGMIAPSLRIYALDAQREADGLTQALGGVDRVSEQRKALVQDVARAGLLVRALFANTLQSDVLDLEAVARISTLVSLRLKGLLALGLGRAEDGVNELDSDLAGSTGRISVW